MTLPRHEKGIQNDRFGGRIVRPGDVLQTDLKVSETFTHRPARIPVTVVRGTEPGPTLNITAAVHGDEINGIAIVRRLLDTLEPDMVRGTVIGVPVVNRFGFQSQERYLPDRRDLNRFFPGDRHGSMASRIAHHVFKHVVRISDAGIDLHTAGAGQSNLCHIRGDADDPEVRELMRSFGTPIMMHSAGPKGSLRRAATLAGVPTVIFEAGEPRRFQHHVVEIGHEGVLRVMKAMGMVERRFRRPALQILVRKTEWIRSDHGGLLDLTVEPGDLVQANQRVGVIHDPFGRHVDEIKAPNSGVVLSTATVPLTNPGNAIVHVGHLDKTLQRARRYVKEGGDLGHVHWMDAVARMKRQRAKAAKAATSAKKGGKKAAPAKKAGRKAAAKQTGRKAAARQAQKRPLATGASATKTAGKAGAPRASAASARGGAKKGKTKAADHARTLDASTGTPLHRIDARPAKQDAAPEEGDLGPDEGEDET